MHFQTPKILIDTLFTPPCNLQPHLFITSLSFFLVPPPDETTRPPSISPQEDDTGDEETDEIKRPILRRFEVRRTAAPPPHPPPPRRLPPPPSSSMCSTGSSTCSTSFGSDSGGGVSLSHGGTDRWDSGISPGKIGVCVRRLFLTRASSHFPSGRGMTLTDRHKPFSEFCPPFAANEILPCYPPSFKRTFPHCTE